VTLCDRTLCDLFYLSPSCLFLLGAPGVLGRFGLALDGRAWFGIGAVYHPAPVWAMPWLRRFLGLVSSWTLTGATAVHLDGRNSVSGQRLIRGICSKGFRPYGWQNCRAGWCIPISSAARLLAAVSGSLRDGCDRGQENVDPELRARQLSVKKNDIRHLAGPANLGLMIRRRWALIVYRVGVTVNESTPNLFFLPASCRRGLSGADVPMGLCRLFGADLKDWNPGRRNRMSFAAKLAATAFLLTVWAWITG